MTHNSDLFDGMVVFHACVTTGSLASAARHLGHSPSHITKQLARLEERLSARLLNRTTRSLSLTAEGEVYFDTARQLIADAEDAGRRIAGATETPSGLLRVSVPVSFCRLHLEPQLPAFLAAYPEIRLDLNVSDRAVDIIGEGYDLAIRAGQLEDTGLIARRLMTSRRMTVASPSYLDVNGLPLVPQDLADHVLIDFAGRDVQSQWRYRAPDGATISVPVAPRITTTSADTELALAVAGTGVTRLPELICGSDLAAGGLVPLLEDYEERPIGVYALYPSRRYLASRVRVLIDFLGQTFGRE